MRKRGTTVGMLVLLGVAVIIGLVIVVGRSVASRHEAQEKAEKFDAYCQTVRATIDSVLHDLKTPRWREMASERFVERNVDLERCAPAVVSVEDWDRFARCRLDARVSDDYACVQAFVTRARDAIPLLSE